MDQYTEHKIEMLEAELRQYRQSLRIISEAILAGKDQDWLEALASQAKAEVLKED